MNAEINSLLENYSELTKQDRHHLFNLIAEKLEDDIPNWKISGLAGREHLRHIERPKHTDLIPSGRWKVSKADAEDIVKFTISNLRFKLQNPIILAINRIQRLDFDLGTTFKVLLRESSKDSKFNLFEFLNTSGQEDWVQFNIPMFAELYENNFFDINISESKKDKQVKKDENGKPILDNGKIQFIDKSAGEFVLNRNRVNFNTLFEHFLKLYDKKVDNPLQHITDYNSVYSLYKTATTQEMYIYISDNPHDILSMSISHFYDSCQNIYNGMYRQQTFSNVLDENMKILYLYFPVNMIKPIDGAVAKLKFLPLIRTILRASTYENRPEHKRILMDRIYPQNVDDFNRDEVITILNKYLPFELLSIKDADNYEFETTTIPDANAPYYDNKRASKFVDLKFQIKPENQAQFFLEITERYYNEIDTLIKIASNITNINLPIFYKSLTSKKLHFRNINSESIMLLYKIFGTEKFKYVIKIPKLKAEIDRQEGVRDSIHSIVSYLSSTPNFKKLGLIELSKLPDAIFSIFSKDDYKNNYNLIYYAIGKRMTLPIFKDREIMDNWIETLAKKGLLKKATELSEYPYVSKFTFSIHNFPYFLYIFTRVDYNISPEMFTEILNLKLDRTKFTRFFKSHKNLIPIYTTDQLIKIYSLLGNSLFTDEYRISLNYEFLQTIVKKNPMILLQFDLLEQIPSSRKSDSQEDKLYMLAIQNDRENLIFYLKDYEEKVAVGLYDSDIDFDKWLKSFIISEYPNGYYDLKKYRIFPSDTLENMKDQIERLHI